MTPALAFHPLCAIFPGIPEDETSALAEDLREHGLIEPIELYGTTILDGRNRYLACQRAGVAPATQQAPGVHRDEDAVRFVINRMASRSQSRSTLSARRPTFTHGVCPDCYDKRLKPIIDG